eukprot:scaffold2752_cov179-Ochromonas_danica.AAC.7
MKILALIKFDDQERTFIIPCGTGNKTFKWLGNVASQRFAQATPVGTLRRREQLCSGSDSHQFQAMSIKTLLGEMPNPNEFLVDHLHDGDEVIIELCSVLPVDSTSSSAKPSTWSTMAYSISQSNLRSSYEGKAGEDEGEDSDGESLAGSDIGGSGADGVVKVDSHINFMKLLLKSQQVNLRAVEKEVEAHIPYIQKALPRLMASQLSLVRSTLIAHWDMLLDLFAAYAAEEKHITKDNFFLFVEDSGIFSVLENATQSLLVFNRTCSHCDISPNTFDFDCFLVSLLLAAQLKFNDTMDPKINVGNCSNALKRVFDDHLLSLAHRLDCLSVLKQSFFSDEVMLKIRYHYDTLQDLFMKNAVKLRDVPTVNILHMSGIMPNQHAQDIDRCRHLLLEVRKGSIHGRIVDILTAVEGGNMDFAEKDYPASELTFAEFVECVARANYYQNAKNTNTNKSTDESQPESTGEAGSVKDLMIRGITLVADFALGKTLKRTSSKERRFRAGRK